jgi:uncharacterized protein (TIGR03437 family)
MLTITCGGAALAGALALLDHPRSVRAQQASHLQIASISVSADQTLTYPHAAPTPYLDYFPDEHMTFFPPASGTAPYLVFGASAVAGGGNGQAVVLETTDLQTFKFATDLGYSPVVMTTPNPGGTCNPTFATEFDEDYAAPGFVAQDPTLPAGNLIMLFEAENHCVAGVYNGGTGYASTGFARSSDNGKTWPAPQNGPTGGPNRYPVLQSVTTAPTASAPFIGNQASAGLIDKSLDGNTYLYATYQHPGVGEPQSRMARAALGQNDVSFMKWYGGSFSQPGIGGLDSQVVPNVCGGHPGQSSLYYVDDIGLYLLTFVCSNGPLTAQTAAWYYSTATSLDLQDWSAPQVIQGSQFSTTPSSTCSGGTLNLFDGWYPSFMSPGAATGHLKLAGTVFHTTGCILGTRTFTSRTFTITTQQQPAPVLTSGSLANGATYVSGGLVPGSWAQVKGTGLANTTRIWAGFDFLNLGNNLPTSLSGVQVMVNGIPAAVYYVSPTQVDFQVPSGVSGTASVQVIVNGTASNTLTASAPASAPGLFPNTVNGVNYPAGVYASGQFFVGPSNVPGYLAASPGFHIELYATGLLAEPGGVLPTAASIPGVTVTIGTVTVPADFAGQTPYVGEFQINFTVPQQMASMAAGNYPISISVNGVSSPTTINSSPPGQIVLPFHP